MVFPNDAGLAFNQALAVWERSTGSALKDAYGRFLSNMAHARMPKVGVNWDL